MVKILKIDKYNLQFLLNDKDIISKIKNEVKENRLLNALLLAHGYIEAYLFELILYSGEKPINIKSFSKNTIENIERINFNTLLHINLILSNIPFDLYKRILEFNKYRNNIVHGLVGIDLRNEKEKKNMIKQIKNAMEIIPILYKIYDRKIKEKSEIFEKNS